MSWQRIVPENAPAVASQVPPLNAPLLRDASVAASAPTAAPAGSVLGRTIRRLAAWHGPDPTTTTAVLLVVTGCCYCLEASARLPEAPGHTSALSGVDGRLTAGVQQASRVASDGSLEFVNPSFSTTLLDFDLTFSNVLIAGAIITCLIAFTQHCIERLMCGLFAEAFSKSRNRYSMCLGSDLEILGGVTASLLRGRLVVSDVVLRSPPRGGYQSEYLLKVRRVVADIGGPLSLVWSAMSGRVEVRELRIDGLDIVVEHEGALVEGRTNLQALFDHLEGVGASSPPPTATPLDRGGTVSVGSVLIQGAVARQWATATTKAKRLAIADRSFDSFTKELHVGKSVGDVLAAFSKTVTIDALASVAAQSE